MCIRTPLLMPLNSFFLIRWIWWLCLIGSQTFHIFELFTPDWVPRSPEKGLPGLQDSELEDKLSSQRPEVSWPNWKANCDMYNGFQLHRRERMDLLLPQSRRAWRWQVLERPQSLAEGRPHGGDCVLVVGPGSQRSPAAHLVNQQGSLLVFFLKFSETLFFCMRNISILTNWQKVSAEVLFFWKLFLSDLKCCARNSRVELVLTFWTKSANAASISYACRGTQASAGIQIRTQSDSSPVGS